MNKLYCGDNLKIMEGMADASIDLIATDPPFNTGKDWEQFNDKWEGGLKGYLKFMQPRIEQMHRLLKDTGSLYLHCDPTASHYLKVMLDEVFGIKQFRNEIVWKRSWATQNHVKSKYPIEHDVILFYAKNDNIFHKEYQPLTERTKKEFRHKDKDGRLYNRRKPNERSSKELVIYLDKSKGAVIGTMWLIKSKWGSRSGERTGYPTQKPVFLYERMIKASSNAGDIVLDPFCGSGTTLVAANKLDRKYIGIDRNPEAIRISEERLKQLNLFTEG